jgi:predicted lipoprotein with Yx(FWY)xxD motif
MKKSSSIVVAIVVIAVLVVGGYAIFHKSSKTTSSTASNSSSKSKAPAVNNAVITTKTDSKLGQYLADPSGKALYTYSADNTDLSNCTGSCLTNWPPYVAKSSATKLPAGISTIKRSDNGKIQYTYNGMPLYYFASDSAGKVTGNGVDNFQIATPSAASSSQPTSTPSSSTPSQSNSNSSSGYHY